VGRMHVAVFEVLQPVHERAAERLGRRYVIGFEDTHLTVQRSGPVRSPSVYVERYETHEKLVNAVKEKIKRRVYHGYVLIWWSANFPLLGWMRERECPIERRAIVPPAIQLDLPRFD
jgi:hypothetical protein